MKFILSLAFVGTTYGRSVIDPKFAPSEVPSSLYPSSGDTSRYPVSEPPSWGDTSRYPISEYPSFGDTSRYPVSEFPSSEPPSWAGTSIYPSLGDTSRYPFSETPSWAGTSRYPFSEYPFSEYPFSEFPSSEPPSWAGTSINPSSGPPSWAGTSINPSSGPPSWAGTSINPSSGPPSWAETSIYPSLGDTSRYPFSEPPSWAGTSIYPSLGDTSRYPFSEYPFSEYPFSEFPSSEYPSLGETSLYPSSDRCPDTVAQITETLQDVFGDENCMPSIDSLGRFADFDCSFTNPTWFTASARFTFMVDENRPYSFSVYETFKYGSSGADFIDFECSADAIGPGGTCIETSAILRSIELKIQNPEDGPQCENADGDVAYGNKGKKSITCADLALKPHKKRARLCKNNSELTDNCPGTCQVQDCSCINIDGPFKAGRVGGEARLFTCEQLARMEEDKKRKRCEKPKYNVNCPNVCLFECKANF